jgi:long-chain acyl-CoA synthetase
LVQKDLLVGRISGRPLGPLVGGNRNERKASEPAMVYATQTVATGTRSSGPDFDAAATTTESWGIDRFLGHLLHRTSSYYSAQVALVQRTPAGWTELTYRQLDTTAVELATRLAESGVQPGDRVAVVAEPGISWVVAFLGTIFAGAVAVPVDIKLTVPETVGVLDDAAPVAIVASTTLQPRATLLSDKATSPCTVLVVADPGVLAQAAPDEARPDRPMTALSAWQPHEPAVIAYTSGTSGEPKGVMLSFANLMSQVKGLTGAHRVSSDDVFLSILPSNHTFELTCGLLTVLYSGAQIVYPGSLLPEDVLGAARERKVTHMVVVPLFLRLVRRQILSALTRAPAPQRRAIRVAARLASHLPFVSARRRLLAPVLRRIGPELRTFYVGGAPLEADVARFFQHMGVEVFQGYGLTEASPVVTMNAPRANRLGSVGRALPGVEVRILPDDSHPAGEGEILVRGPNVMLGYHRNPVASSQAIDPEGWLYTGDLGLIDSEGFLHVSGRAKNLIVLPNGKNVQPEEVEAALEQSESIGEACVFAGIGTHGVTEGTEQVHAVVVPAEAVLARRLGEEETVKYLEEEARRAVVGLAAFKRPARVTVSLAELPKTTTRKVRRNTVAALYR